MGRKTPLNEKQLAVLNWVAEGRPKGVYEGGFEHRVTARALERRGLLSIRGHGQTWRATLTGDGRYYAKNGIYPPSAESEKPQPPALSKHPRQPEPINDLLERLEASDGSIELEAPTTSERVRYRRAVERLRTSGGLGSDQRLRMTGTKRGPLRIQVLQVDPPAEFESAIPVPEEADLRRPEIAALAADVSLLPVSDERRGRALAMAQAVSQECARRGWDFEVAHTPSFGIAVGEDKYWCTLSEERVKRDVYTDEDVAQRKYDWQRVSPTRMEVWSGRLRLEFGSRYDSHWWADRRRWTLASKLPDVFATIDQLAEARRLKKDKLRVLHEQQVKEWEQAKQVAREKHLQELNERRAQEQADAWDHSQKLRFYAEALKLRAQELDGDAREAVCDWASRLVEQADKTDPLTDVDRLRYTVPEELGSAELDRYMPNGWTTKHPPDPPTWLPA